MNQRQKHPDALVDRRAGRYRPLAPVEPPPQPRTPSLPKTASREVRRVWRELWRSSLAGAFKPTDIPALRRWAWWLDQWLRAASEIEAESITVQGANGLMLNPKVRYLKQCETALRELERAFGMDALARLRLGITFADQQSKSAALRQPAKPEAM